MLDVSLIADLPPFAGINPASLGKFVAKAKPLRFARGEHIFEAGAKAESFFLLLDGHIRVVRITPEGEQVIARYISSGELFGIASAMGLDAYPANAIAAVDCVVLAWPSTIWQQTIDLYPGFATNTYKVVGQRLQQAQERIVEMATERVEQRVASAVVKLARQTGKQTSEGVLINFPVSRQDISEMTGTTLHTVSRIISAWEGAGLVKCGRQKIVVTQGDRLELLAKGAKN